MHFRSVFGVAVAAVALVWAGAAIATPGSCIDFATEQLLATINGNMTDHVSVQVAPGDTLSFRLTYNVDGFSIGRLESANINSGLINEQWTPSSFGPGSHSLGPVVVTTASNQIDYAFTGFLSVQLYLTCTPAPVSAGTDIDYIQDGVLKHATINSTQMINDLVDGGVDAAFSAQADKSAGSLGFTSGGIVVDATPDALKGSPFAVWSGVRYGLTPGGANNWSGMQVSGAAGVNYSASDTLILGAFGAYEADGYNLKANSQSFTGSGPTAGLVAAYRLGDNWRIEATGYASLLGYNIDDAGTTGKFGAVRYVLKGTLSGAMPLNANVDFVPVASLSVVREDEAAYVDSAAANHAAQTVLAGQGSAGGKFVFYPTDGLVTFWAGGYGDYWIGDAFGGGLSGRVEAGTDIGFGDTGKVGLKVEASHIGTSATTYAASASVGGAL